MEKQLFQDHQFVGGLLDIIPAMLLVVDDDVNIKDSNKTVADFLNVGKESTLHSRAGEILRCIHHTDVPEGCGRGPECNDCIIRNSVNEAVTGKKVTRKQTSFKYLQDQDLKMMHLMVTTAPFTFGGESFILLILEDISEVMKLRKLIPICASCKKIRDDKNFWSEVETYFSETTDVDFSHGICPDCIVKLYPDYAKMFEEIK
ncbi:MAG: hypothetical protein HN590_17210 [Calditrichaeota bacterium]|nr:hypothetical protein [Calditrichota bacterium]MBT7788350.1 hypothetical protein [Calditrichota bacterium]